MKKIILAVLAFLALILVTSVSVNALVPSLTVVSGKVFELNSSVVDGATVTVNCTHNNVSTLKTTTSVADGTYSVVFPVAKCAPGDVVEVTAIKDDATGTGDGTVEHSGRCIVNTALIDVTIPEFGVIAGTLALIAGIGVIVYRRKN